jgi:peptidase E
MAGRQPTIIALGGGGFSMEPENPALDTYLLAHANGPRPKVCFIPTASGDADRYLFNYYAAFARYNCAPTHLKLFGRTPDPRTLLLDQDLIFVGGGNTKSMLAVWKEWELPDILRQAWQQGTVLSGISAGAICWFQQGLTDSWADRLRSLSALGFLSGSCCPHFDGEAERKPSLHAMLLSGEMAAGYAIDDSAALHFEGDAAVRAVCSRPKAKAYRVHAANGQAVEEAFAMHLLT